MRSTSFALSLLLLASASFAIAQDAPAPAPAEPAVAAPLSFKLDQAKSSIYAVTRKDGLAAAIAHDHVIVARQMSGAITFDAANPASSKISVTVDVASMTVDEAAARKMAGLEGEPDADTQADVKKNMLAEDQLNSAKFPKMTFESTSITPKGGESYTVAGNLTIRGVTKPVSFTAKVTATDAGFKGTGTIPISHTMFGFQPYSAMFGAVKNQDPITLHMSIVGTPG